MCSKRCKHTLRDRIPLCTIGRRCSEQPNSQPLTSSMLQKEELSLVDCDNCRVKSGSDEHACACPGGTGATGGSETTDQQSFQPSEHEGMNSPVITELVQINGTGFNEGTLIKKIPENGNRYANIKSGGGSIKYEYDKSTPSSIRRMDEWEAMAVMLATNGRVWAGEDIGFARQFKAALSAVNTKFEEEAATMAGATTY